MKPLPLIFSLALTLITIAPDAASTETEEIDWSAFVVEESFTPGENTGAETVRLWLDLHPGLNWRSTDAIQETLIVTEENSSEETAVRRRIEERFGRVIHRSPGGSAVIAEMVRLGRAESREGDRWASDRRPTVPFSCQFTMDSQGRVRDLEMEWPERIRISLPLVNGLIIRAERFIGPERARPGDQWTVTVRHPAFPDAVAICRTAFLGFETESDRPLAVLEQDLEIEIPHSLLHIVEEDRRGDGMIEYFFDHTTGRGSAERYLDLTSGRLVRSREVMDLTTNGRIRTSNVTGDPLSEEHGVTVIHQEVESTIDHRN
jgi:hypothetical protein